MTWEEKLAALQCLGEVSLHMRKPGDWYVSQRVTIGGDGMLRGEYGNGKTPEAAVEQHWAIYSADLLNTNKYVVVESHGKRRHVVWVGYMWWDICDPADLTK